MLGASLGRRLVLPTAMVMVVTIIGGILLQFPIGLLFDQFNRRTIIISLSTMAAAISLLIVTCGQVNFKVAAFAPHLVRWGEYLDLSDVSCSRGLPFGRFRRQGLRLEWPGYFLTLTAPPSDQPAPARCSR
jgi:MFS family permease